MRNDKKPADPKWTVRIPKPKVTRRDFGIAAIGVVGGTILRDWLGGATPPPTPCVQEPQSAAQPLPSDDEVVRAAITALKSASTQKIDQYLRENSRAKKLINHPVFHQNVAKGSRKVTLLDARISGAQYEINLPDIVTYFIEAGATPTSQTLRFLNENLQAIDTFKADNKGISGVAEETAPGIAAMKKTKEIILEKIPDLERGHGGRSGSDQGR